MSINDDVVNDLEYYFSVGIFKGSMILSSQCALVSWKRIIKWYIIPAREDAKLGEYYDSKGNFWIQVKVGIFDLMR